MKILVTGGAGFIGSAVIRHLLSSTDHCVVNVDKLTYAGNLDSLPYGAASQRYHFYEMDICDEAALSDVFRQHSPSVVLHLAAESHVDRSILAPSIFVQTNVLGTFTLLEVARRYYDSLSSSDRQSFVFQHISTDEVFGDLDRSQQAINESNYYDPSSPYAATKASADHLVRAWGRTYNLPFVVSNCTNNYGPYQFPEKFIPRMIINALNGNSLPVYGDGLQIRDWLFVEDHARALVTIFTEGNVGETYNISGANQEKNIDVVLEVCELLDELAPDKPEGVNHYSDLIAHVTDRPGHDLRYAIDSRKVREELGWKPVNSFASGLRKTVKWYIDNQSWWRRIISSDHNAMGLAT